MIPFDIETWKANPDCKVYYKLGDEFKEVTYIVELEGAEIDRFAIVYSCMGFTTDSYYLYLDLPENKPHPNADVIRAYADGLDVYYFDDVVKGNWVKYGSNSVVSDILLGDPDYKWHIGKPEE